MENKNIINRIRNAAGLCLVLVLFTGMANDAFSQEVMVLDLETSMRIALTQSNDIIRQQNSFEQSKLGLEFAKANQRTTTRLSWSLPSYSKSIRPVATPTGDVYTNNQSFSTNASLRITQPVRWTDGTFTFTTNYSANNQYTLEKDGSKRQNHNWTDSFNINYSQPLFQPNEQIFDWDQTQRDFTIAERKYEQTENSIWLNVMRDFYDLYSTKQRLEIAQANYDNTFKNYEMAVNKYNAGILALVDKYQWESNILDAQNSLYNQELSYQSKKDNFKRTIGLPLDQQIDVVAEIDVKFIEIDEQQAFDEAFARSISLDDAHNSIVVQKHNISVQQSADKINASLSLSYGLNENDEFGEFWSSNFYNQGGDYSYENWSNNLFKDFNRSNSISININIPIWDSGRRKLRLQTSDLQLDQSERNITIQEEQLQIQIQNSLYAVRNARDRITLNAKSIRTAELEYDINYQKFTLGEISSDQLTNSNNRLTSAKINVLDAQIDYLTTLASLYNQTFWDFENNCPLNETVGKIIGR